MSEEDLKVVDSLFRAWNRSDRDDILERIHPEATWSSAIQREVEGSDRIYTGRTEIGQFWDEWHALWDMDIDVTEMRDLGDGRVVALASVRSTGKTGGVEVERLIGYVIEIEAGLIRRARAYLSPDHALEAAGLSE